MESESCLSEILKRGNLKSTKHRITILKVISNQNIPLSAEDLYIILKENGISISLSTVYRVLETLNEKGIVVRTNIPDENKAVYELYDNEHKHHLLCVKCRKILPVDGCPLEEYEKILENRFGFAVKGHKLEVYGYCNSCKN